jgi:hypothetical protein
MLIRLFLNVRGNIQICSNKRQASTSGVASGNDGGPFFLTYKGLIPIYDSPKMELFQGDVSAETNVKGLFLVKLHGQEVIFI